MNGVGWWTRALYTGSFVLWKDHLCNSVCPRHLDGLVLVPAPDVAPHRLQALIREPLVTTSGVVRGSLVSISLCAVSQPDH